MKKLGELMRRDPRDDREREILHRVTTLALKYETGRIDEIDIRRECSGYERFQAMNFATLGSPEKRVIQDMIDGLCAEQELSRGR